MLFATLGKLDLITVLILIGAAILPSKLLVFAALYLILKGVIFGLLNKDFASYGDLFSGFYLLVLSTGIKIPYLHQVVFFWLLQKTIMTFIAIGLKLMIFYYEYKEKFPSFLR
jgi:hypothetical protein